MKKAGIFVGRGKWENAAQATQKKDMKTPTLIPTSALSRVLIFTSSQNHPLTMTTLIYSQTTVSSISMVFFSMAITAMWHLGPLIHFNFSTGMINGILGEIRMEWRPGETSLMSLSLKPQKALVPQKINKTTTKKNRIKTETSFMHKNTENKYKLKKIWICYMLIICVLIRDQGRLNMSQIHFRVLLLEVFKWNFNFFSLLFCFFFFPVLNTSLPILFQFAW